MSTWKQFANITLDASTNTLPGGNAYHYEKLPAGVYKFRIDPNSRGVNYARYDAGFAYSKAAGMMVLNAPQDESLGNTFYYGLNCTDGMASEVIHAAPAGAGFDLFFQDWNTGDNVGSVTVIVEQWQP
ncbi:hypothetical protein BG58_37480 [Caballeronia jiangsuensis]|nr:hypothetical protein BG58_37480 [Caballeronia jiangsuensis]